MLRLYPLLALVALAAAPRAQAPASARALLDAAAQAGAIADPAARDAAIDALWTSLRPGQATSRVPFVAADSAVFLWRGSAQSVAVAGDHTGWSPNAALTRQGTSTLWLRLDRFDPAARIDYKLVLNGSNWILDGANPYRQTGGAGPNSELRMPGWRQEPLTVRDLAVPRGALGAATSITSTHYTTGPVTYRVWTPAGYAASAARLPVVYVTDGQEYSDEALGAMLTVLDNAIAQNLIEPCIAVFIDPRIGSTNQRQEQYVNNAGFAAFVAEDLVPAVDAAYRTRADRGSRVILGTSLGGLFSVYLGATRPETFGLLAVHSPAFWISEDPRWGAGPTVYALAQQSAAGAFRVAMTAGTIRDTATEARRMRDILNTRGHAVSYLEVPEGHSWGNWRAHIDDVLIPLIPAMPSAGEAPPAAGRLSIRAVPNPVRATGAAVFVTAAGPASVHVTCVDAQGRIVFATAGMDASAGEVTVGLGATRLAAGVYVCRATAGRDSAAVTLTVLP